MWDPGDKEDIIFEKQPNKGCRYCFASAIQGPDPRVETPVFPHQQAGIIPGVTWIFCPQKKKSHQGDYHKVFNGKNFVNWWKEILLPNLTQPSVIILDNAKYHMVYGEHVPKPSKMKKADCIKYLKKRCYSILTTFGNKFET